MNFKRIFSITLSVILIFSCISGCKKTKTPTIENVSSNPTEEKITFAETIVKTDQEAIYKLGEDIKVSSTKVDILVNQGMAHIFSNMGGTTQAVGFSVYENAVLSQVTLTGEALNYGVLGGGEFYAVNLETATLSIYEKSGQLKSEKQICDSALRFGALNTTGQFLIYQKANSTSLFRYDLLTDQTKESQEKINIVGTPSHDDDGVYVKDSSGKHYRIEFDSFEIVKTRTEAFREYVDCMGVAVEKDFFTLTSLKPGNPKQMAEKLGEEKIVAAQEERFITLSSTNRYFRLYNMGTGLASGEIEVEGEKQETTGRILDAQFVGDDYILLALEYGGTNEIYFRLFNITENESKVIFDADRLQDSVIYEDVFVDKDSEAEKLAQEITEKHKIRFFYGKTGEGFKTDFSYLKVTDEDLTSKLSMAEKVLDEIPPELLMEATADREIWVYFCKKLDNKGTEYSKLSAITELYNHKLILIDVSCNDERFAELLCHGFAHILDDYMSESIKDGFSQLTPDNIKAAGYTNSYQNIPSDQYTPYDSDKSNVWFYNSYCRINEKEDRTYTLGEMFRIYVVQASGEKFSYEIVKKKAAYMSYALEQTFDYCKEADKQLWEIAFPYSE